MTFNRSWNDASRSVLVVTLMWVKIPVYLSSIEKFTGFPYPMRQRSPFSFHLRGLSVRFRQNLSRTKMVVPKISRGFILICLHCWMKVFNQISTLKSKIKVASLINAPHSVIARLIPIFWIIHGQSWAY